MVPVPDFFLVCLTVNFTGCVHLGVEVGAGLVADGDEFLLGGGGGGHFGFDFAADGSVEGATETTVRGDGDVELLLRIVSTLDESNRLTFGTFFLIFSGIVPRIEIQF